MESESKQKRGIKIEELTKNYRKLRTRVFDKRYNKFQHYSPRSYCMFCSPFSPFLIFYTQNETSLCLAYISCNNTWVCQSAVILNKDRSLSAVTNHFAPFAIITGMIDKITHHVSKVSLLQFSSLMGMQGNSTILNYNFIPVVIVATLFCIYLAAMYIG